MMIQCSRSEPARSRWAFPGLPSRRRSRRDRRLTEGLRFPLRRSPLTISSEWPGGPDCHRVVQQQTTTVHRGLLRAFGFMPGSSGGEQLLTTHKPGASTGVALQSDGAESASPGPCCTSLHPLESTVEEGMPDAPRQKARPVGADVVGIVTGIVGMESRLSLAEPG